MMETINSLARIIELSQDAADKGQAMYIRWSRGLVLDAKQGASKDYNNYQTHNGLSAQPVRHDNSDLLAQMIPEYRFLQRKDSKIFCWLFTGQQNGTDSDNAPTIAADSIKPVGKVGKGLIDKCVELNEAYRNHRQNYAYNPNASQRGKDRNVVLDAALDAARKAL